MPVEKMPEIEALIDCHFESGTRPGEILNLQIRHVKFDKYGAVLHVDGKTGARSIRLVKLTPSLAYWLSVYPLKDDTFAPLWPNTSYRNCGKALTYAVDQKFLSASGLLLINFIASSSRRAVLKYSDGTWRISPTVACIRILGHRALPGANTPPLSH